MNQIPQSERILEECSASIPQLGLQSLKLDEKNQFVIEVFNYIT